MLRIRALLLDLDDTLLDDRSAVRAGVTAFIAAHQAKLPALPFEELLALWRAISHRHWVRFESGELSYLEQRRCRVRDLLAGDFSDAEADEAFHAYHHAYAAAWRLFPEAAVFLERTRHFPKVIITNGDRAVQRAKVRATGLAEHVLGTITPADCGYWKPHPQIFRTALALLGVEPAACLMVGDDWTRDIEPACKLGMRHYQVEPGHPERNIANALAVE